MSGADTNQNGYIRDIYQTTNRDYIEKNEPVLFNNRSNYSLHGIIEETPVSDLFFSDMNVRAIQETIRYKINKLTGKTISFQSPNELFIIMRSIYLQNGNAFVNSSEAISDIKKLNKMVTDYSIKNVKDQIDQYNGYILKISGAPTPIALPESTNTNSYTYDSSNILR